MPFAFLAPIFLVGLAALAVPILIHLSSRPRKKTVDFPSLMFLEKVEYQDSSKRRLRHLVLFALRSLALIALAAAFARPFLDRPDVRATAPDGGRELVVLLDRSASMGVDGRLDEARDRIGALADGLRRGDRATLVVFDQEAAAVNRATDQPAVLRNAADTVTASAAGTRLAPALRLAESILSGTPLPRRELVLITDFQRTAWDPDAAARMPAGTEIRTVAVGAPVANTFVADVRFGRERFSGRERVRVAAAIAHRGSAATDGGPRTADGGPGQGGAGAEIPVELVLDGRTLARTTVTVPAGGAASVEFDPITLPDRAVRGTVRAGTDAFPEDNAFHFVLNAGRDLRLLVVEPRAGDTPPFLRRALQVSPDYAIESVAADRLGQTDLGRFDVVLVNGADPGNTARLEAFVEAGGGLVAVLGGTARARTWAELVPGRIQGTRADESGAALAALRSEHPIFAPFRSGGGLTGARFYRYRDVEPAQGAEVLARFGDGAPALVAGERGRGRVVVLTSPLDGAWNDLVLQPGFVPLSHRLVEFASGREPGPAWRTVGELLAAGGYLVDDAVAAAAGSPERGGEAPDAPATGEGSSEGQARDRRALGDRPVVLTPSDRPVPVDGSTLFPLRERGFYEVRDPRSGELGVPVAVNGPVSESDLAMLDPEVVRAAVSGGDAAPSVASFAPEDQERRQSLWWYVLMGAFVLLAAETLLSNALSRRPLPTLKGGGE